MQSVMGYALAYVLCLLLFAAIDITWLMTMGGKLYKQTLGDILLPQVFFPPAVAFYLLYPVGVIIFSVAPALKTGSLTTALTYGALFGLFTYGTYELTNFATLRNWTLQITLIDIAYGAIATGTIAALVTMLTPRVAAFLGAGS
jgi:uncharacterized membrane protein